MLTEAHKQLFRFLAAERLAQIKAARALAAATYHAGHRNVLEADVQAQEFEAALAELERIPITHREAA